MEFTQELETGTFKMVGAAETSLKLKEVAEKCRLVRTDNGVKVELAYTGPNAGKYMQYIEKQQYPIMPNDLLYIDKVVLTTTVQQTKNERNTYYLMPVWMCYMRILDKETHELRNEGDYWVYCYNAIDGSRVRLS